MNGAFEIGGVGLVAQQKALDTIANNIANLNTAAFKRSDVQFSEMYAQQSGAFGADLKAGTFVGHGVQAKSSSSLAESGEIRRTDAPLDIAIDGQGFIEILGPGGQSYLWRGGSLSIDTDGYLSAGPGLVLRSMINVPLEAKSLRIAANGVVTVQTASDEQSVEVGQITLVRTADLNELEPVGGGIYRVPDGMALTDFVASEDGAGTLVQGAIEQSNVELNQEMVELMIIQRAYAANAQIIQAADQLAGIANGLRR